MQGLHSEEVTRERAASTTDEQPAEQPAEQPSDQRTVITLSPPVAAAVRRMGDQLGHAGPTEVVRRGLMLLDVLLSLRGNEELVIRNTDTGQSDRLRFAWQTF